MASWFQVLEVMVNLRLGFGFVAAVEEEVRMKRVMLGWAAAEVRMCVTVAVTVGIICRRVSDR